MLRSRGELPEIDTDIYVVDTMGELGLIYRLAPIVFMGGSLASHGGQNPDRAGQARRGYPAWTACLELCRNLCRARQLHTAAERVTDVGKLTVRLGAWLRMRRRAGPWWPRRAPRSAIWAARSIAPLQRSIPI